jgi:YidC/Oxa1 family membrane protein insertase
MEKKTFLAIVLIGLIIILYPLYMQFVGGKKKTAPIQPKEVAQVDTNKTVPESLETKPPSLDVIAEDTTKKEKFVTIKTKLYEAKFSTKGGNLVSFLLNKFKYFDNGKVELLPDKGLSALNISFPDLPLDLSNHFFEPDKDSLILNGESGTLTFNWKSSKGTSFTKVYTFYNNKYSFDLKVSGSGFEDLGRNYNFSWASGIKTTEKNVGEDLSYFAAYSMSANEIFKTDKFKTKEGASYEVIEESHSGDFKWVATRSKYFSAFLVPLSSKTSGYSVSGKKIITQEGNKKIADKIIGASLEMPVQNKNEIEAKFLIYVGPIDYNILKSYNFGWENVVNLGAKILRPFSIAILWFFVTFYKAIPNYGAVIIIFTAIIKLLFHPLTVKSVTASIKMQQVQPKITKLKEKYKKDAQGLNKEIMKLYKDHKVNPFGGCLPLLLQLPFFWALFTVFKSTIEFRAAKFIFWIKDLSQMDQYFILPVIMAVTMFFQQKMTLQDPKQKMMVYLMPVLFFFLFKSFPAGLTLYWTVFNLFSLIEQIYIKSKSEPLVISE